MLDPESVKWFATLGVGGILAAFMFLFYRKDARQFADMWAASSAAFAQIVKENTTAITANTKTIESLHRREDDVERQLERYGYKFPHRGKSDDGDQR
jgi:hypothetical protein